MEAAFEITRRRPGEKVAEQDARRVGAMRRIARAFLAYHRLPGMACPVMLIVSELVTNAITHSGGSEVACTMQIQDDLLYFAVRSDVATVPSRAKAGDDDEHGRGLELVDLTVSGLGGTWGIGNDGTVWCLLPAKGAAQ
ncbi:ATP-binding protein [Streptomyces sp. NPDC049915]|uniref:ATP-binding protein n=1 Tax=Streptomyces sp. NPDC049915 TaxID=3155510 RepID=UPI00343E4461